MKKFSDIFEATKLKEIPAVKKPAQAKVPSTRESIPGLGKGQIEPVEKTDAKLEQVKEAILRPRTIKDSEDAQNHLEKLGQYIEYALTYISDKSLVKFLAATDDNFETDTSYLASQLEKTLKTAEKAYIGLHTEFYSAE